MAVDLATDFDEAVGAEELTIPDTCKHLCPLNMPHLCDTVRGLRRVAGFIPVRHPKMGSTILFLNQFLCGPGTF